MNYHNDLSIYNFMMVIVLLLCMTGCDSSTDPLLSDLYNNRKASIDRFSDKAGTLFQRSSNHNLPNPNEPIHFDEAPFLTKGLGPDGETIEFYNFDVMPPAPSPLYVLFRKGENKAVENQQNIVDVIPGDKGYNDFWQIYRVIVPADYTANSAKSVRDIREKEYNVEPTPKIVNCPIVPDGSTANKRFNEENVGLDRGWYKGQIIYYFNFTEKILSTEQTGRLPTSSLYVSFNINPGQDGGGPISGFKTKKYSEQTHNVAATLPTDNSYSALRNLIVYDNADFDRVTDLSSAQNANILVEEAAIVNFPVVRKPTDKKTFKIRVYTTR